MKLYWKLKKLKKGVVIQISLTMRCNYNCPYCLQKYVEGKMPVFKEVGFLSWVRFFKRFPCKIKEVYVSGGEPTMHNDFVRIVKWLLSQGYFVNIFTNLSKPDVLLQVPRCHRVKIQSTYHHAVKRELFERNYNLLKNKYQVNVDEIDYKILPYSVVKRMEPIQNNDNYDIKCLRISPNLRININCYELISQKLPYERL